MFLKVCIIETLVVCMQATLNLVHVYQFTRIFWTAKGVLTDLNINNINEENFDCLEARFLGEK